MRRALFTAIVLVAVLAVAIPGLGQRRINPVNTPATRTQSHNDAEGDSLRALERKRARSIHYHDENGRTVMIDTVTGIEWVDSTMLPKPPKMKYQLLHSINVGVNIWDPVMRLFGQHYGGADASVSVSLHNRYLPVFEFGLGAAKNTPDNNNFTYRTPLSPYFKLGCDYNFLYNSNPDYQFYAGVRYGFSTFKFSIEDATLDDGYWGETVPVNIPTSSVTAGWFEVGIGLRVKLAGHISAGWGIKYHGILHRSHPATGDAWYIPGYGTATSSLQGQFNIVYTIPFKERRKAKTEAADIDGGPDAPTPETP